MEFEQFARFMRDVQGLKEVSRTGWVRVGIQDAESVADHSFGTAMMAFVLAPRFGVNRERAFLMALVHDLAETQIGDLTPDDGVPKEQKHQMELEALQRICGGIDGGEEILGVWEEMEEGITREAKFVNILDKLEMMFQAREYGKRQPDVDLKSFWEGIQGFDFGEQREIFQLLEASRETTHNPAGPS